MTREKPWVRVLGGLSGEGGGAGVVTGGGGGAGSCAIAGIESAVRMVTVMMGANFI